MGRVIGATIKLDGEAKFKSAVTDINKGLGTLKSETKLVTAEFSGQENTVAALTRKQDLLSKAYDLQKQKTAAVDSGLSNAKKNYESVGKTLDDYKVKLEAAQTALQTMQSSGTATDEELKAQKETVDSLTKTVDNGEKTYAKAGSRIEDWQKKLNYAKTEEINAGNAIKENNQYMYEAVTATDGCATSIDSLGKKTKAAETEVVGFGESANKYFTADIISQYADKASSAMSSLATNAYNATKELDEGYDTIIQKTGATGTAFESLKGIADNIYGSMPVEMSDVGDAISEINHRFDESGTQLESTAKAYLEFAKINNTDVTSSVEESEKVLKQYNESTDQATNFLGLLQKKQQETGISTDNLMSSLEENSATLKIMGLNLTSSTNLLAQFEKNGVDVSQAMVGLKKAVATYTDQGKTAEEGLKETIDSIKNAKTETEAYRIAMDVFGKKGFQPMAVAIREGKIDLDSLSDSLDNYSTVVDDTYQATLDPWDEWTTATNNLKEAGSELAGTVLDDLRPAIKDITSMIKSATTWYSNLDDRTKKLVSTTAALVTGLGVAAPQIVKVGTAIVALKKANESTEAIKALTEATQGVSEASTEAAAATEGLNSSVGLLTGAAPFLTIALGTLAAVGLTALVDSAKPVDQALQALKSDINDTTDAYSQSKTNIDNATSSYSSQTGQVESLVSTIENLNGKESLNTTEKRNLALAVQQLNDLIPDLNLTINDNTGKLQGNTKEILNNIEAKKKQYQEQLKDEKLKTLLEEISNLEIQQKDAEDELAQAKGKTTDALNESVLAAWDEKDVLSSSQKTYDSVTKSLEEAKQQYAELTGDTDVLKSSTDGAAASFDVTTQNVQNFIGATNGAAAATSSLTDAENANQAASQYSISVAGQELDAFNNLSAGEQQMAVDVTNAVYGMQQSVEGSIQSQCDWFGKLSDSGTTTAADIIKSMQDQVDSVHNWEANLTTLSTYTDDAGNHIDQGLLQSLADLGPQGAAYVQALVDDGGASLSQLNDTWSQKVDMTSMTDKWGQDLETGVGNLAAGGEGAFDQLGADLNLKTNESGQYVIQGLIDGMSAAKASLTAQGTDTGTSLLNSLNSALGVASPSTKTYQTGLFIDSGLINGLYGAVGMVRDASSYVGSQSISALMSAANNGSAYSIGLNIDYGMAAGINAGQSHVISAAASVAQSAITAANAKLQVNSPSKVFKRIGGSVIEGFVDGIVAGNGLVKRTVNDTFGVDSGNFATSLSSAALSSAAGSTSTTNNSNVTNVYFNNNKVNDDSGIQKAFLGMFSEIRRRGYMNG